MLAIAGGRGLRRVLANRQLHNDSIFGRFLVPAMATDTERTPALVMLHGYPGSP